MPEDHFARRLALHEAGGSPHDRSKAREAAEALFALKPHSAQSVNSPVAPAAEQSARKPRILSIVPKAAPIPPKPIEAAPAPEKPSLRSIPASDKARMRTWLRYGMTVRQIAEMYGVAGSEIERMLAS